MEILGSGCTDRQQMTDVQGTEGFFSSRSRILWAAVFLFFLVAGFSFPALAGCPSPLEVEKKLTRLTNRKAEIISLQESALSGICEVAVRSGSKVNLLYTDDKGRFFFFGKMVEADTGRNLTSESLASINRLTPEDMEELAFLTAFSAGNDAAPLLYYVTDPHCPYCKRGVEDLKKLLARDRIYVRFLLFPLQSYKGSLEQCVSVVCDKKGLEEFEKGYRSDNQCPEGRLLVESSIDFLKTKGISSTPTYIFSDGRVHTGWLKPSDLERWLKAENTEPSADNQ